MPRIVLNIGLEAPQHRPVEYGAIHRLKNAMVWIVENTTGAHCELRRDLPEQTLVVRFDDDLDWRALMPKLRDLCNACNQDCVAFRVNQFGWLIGPGADWYKPFDPIKFTDHTGVQR